MFSSSRAVSHDMKSSSSPFHRRYKLGVCAMEKKINSKPMREILRRLPAQEFEIILFGDAMILHRNVEDWPVCDALIAFFSSGFPLEKAEAYVALRNPVIVNDLGKQRLFMDRRDVYRCLTQHDITVPRHVFLSRDDPNHTPTVVEEEDFIEVDGVRIQKPFVEKPVDGDDHNVYIYYPMSAGGGCKRLFRKIGNRSSEFHPDENSIRTTGSYIYEEFLSTQGTDVKVYTVGPKYAHAEARKSPVLDGRVLRDSYGKEVRYPVILTTEEKEFARKICLAFEQTVCGFDILRVHQGSYVCDVNGWSFVKNSTKYYDDCSMLLRKILLKAMLNPSDEKRQGRSVSLDIVDNSLSEEQLYSAAAVADQQHPSKRGGKKEELRCVIAVIRHGDRTPKQKMKMRVRHPLFLSYYEKRASNCFANLKIKAVSDLEELLSIAKTMLRLYKEEDAEFMAFLQDRAERFGEDGAERMHGILTLRDVLERFQLCGINRKVQLKPKEWSSSSSSSSALLSSLSPTSASTSAEEEVKEHKNGTGSGTGTGTGQALSAKSPTAILLILKWGGNLTHSGVAQAESLGKRFRHELYPGDAQDGGLLRLHSTYRHDLKIYTSDEGRVQKTAASFAKGFLELDGDIIPILVSLVLMGKDANLMLDQSGTEAQEIRARVKKRLHDMLHRDDDLNALKELASSTLIRSVAAALAEVDQPVKKMEIIYKLLGTLRDQIGQLIKEQEKQSLEKDLERGEDKEKSEDEKNEKNEKSEDENENEEDENENEDEDEDEDDDKKKKDKKRKAEKQKMTGDGKNRSTLAPPCERESLLMMYDRWSKLSQDFYSVKSNTFDLSKIPDIYDCIRYDVLHNAHLQLKSFPELLYNAKSLNEVLVPQEYGINVQEKVSIGTNLCNSLLKKMRDDFDIAKGMDTYRLDPKHAKAKYIKSAHRSVRTRLYFTSESHLHTLINILRYSTTNNNTNTSNTNTSTNNEYPSTKASSSPSSSSPSPSSSSSISTHATCSKDINGGNQHGNEQEQELKKIVENKDDLDHDVNIPLSKASMKWIEEIPELSYMTHIVFRVFEAFTYEECDPRRFRLEILLSPGATADPLQHSLQHGDETPVDVEPLTLISKPGLTSQEFEDYITLAIHYGDSHDMEWRDSMVEAKK